MNVTILTAAVAALIIILIKFIWYQTKDIEITQYDIDLAAGGVRPIKVLQVSDLQSRYFGKEQSALIKKCKEVEADVIVITGDLIDRNYTDYRAASVAVRALSKLAPVFYVDGNHETALSQDEYNAFLEMEAGYMRVLFDRCERFECAGALLNIGGLCEDTVNMSRGYDRKNRNHDEKFLVDTIDRIFENYTIGPKLLLSHEPQLIGIYAQAECDLVLSGHAHGGQFRIPFTNQGVYAPEQGIMPKYTEGIHKKDGCLMAISRGLGNSRFPFRLFNKPELVVLNVK